MTEFRSPNFAYLADLDPPFDASGSSVGVLLH